MLQIYLYGDKEQGFLDIDPSTVLDMESTGDMWDEDLLDGEFSLPIDLPWTANNRRLTGFAERLENFSTAPRSWKVVVYDNGFPEIPAGKLTLLDKSGTFSYLRGKFSASVSGTKGLFGSAIKGKKLASLSLGGPISWAGMDSRQFATQHMQNAAGTTPYFAFAPVAIENFFDESRSDYDNEFLAKDMVNYLVQSGTGSWLFGRPKSSDPTQAAAQLTPEYNDYRTVPFFQLVFVVRRIFEENGYRVYGDFFTSGAWDKLYLHNQCAIEYYSPTSFVDFNRRINPGDHMPDVLIADFLKAVFSFFNLYPVFSGTNEVTLRYRVQELRNRKVASMSSVCSSQFSSTWPDASEQKGYTLKYGQSSTDEYFSERIKDRSNKTEVGRVATLSALYGLSSPVPLTTDCIAFVESENMWYAVADATSNPVKWDAWAEALEPYVKGEGEREVDGGLCPLATYVSYVDALALTARQDAVGTRGQGSYYNNKYVKVTSAFTGLNIFYIGYQNRGTASVPTPVSFCHNRDASNNKLVPYSLAWAGSDGMATLHTDWQAVKENMEVVKTEYVADQKVLSDMASATCHEISGVLFLPQMLERTIPLKKTVTVSLVPL